MENTNLSKQQQVYEIMRQMLTQAQTAGHFFFNDQATTEIYTLSLHDALPILSDAEQQVTTGVDAFWNSSITRMNTSLEDRKSTRLNSSHMSISYAVFCLK